MATTEATEYETHLVILMKDYNLTLSEALDFDFQAECVDMSTVFGPCDFLEEKLVDLEKVQYYMLVWTGQQPDIELKKIQ
jgi:hypothetical protein